MNEDLLSDARKAANEEMNHIRRPAVCSALNQGEISPMKNLRVLIVHNKYIHRGGEDIVVESEAQLLRSRGHPVLLYFENNTQLRLSNPLASAYRAIWSNESNSKLRNDITNFKPNIIHVHNTFPRISPSIFWEARKHSIPTVLTLHNFRLMCPQAMFLRNSEVCEDCLGKIPWRGVMRRCYRNSYLQSSVSALSIYFHRLIGTYRKKVSRYIALSEFSKRKFVEGGFPETRITVKPNFVNVPEDTSTSQMQRNGFLFVGRLSQEKGIAILAAAARALPETTITVIGDGPELPSLVGMKNVHLRGYLSHLEVYKEMRTSLGLLMPSICYENYPRTLVESFACGLPVIASDLGPLAELITHRQTGILVPPNNAAALIEAMQWAIANRERLSQMGDVIKSEYNKQLNPNVNYEHLISIYESAIASHA